MNIRSSTIEKAHTTDVAVHHFDGAPTMAPDLIPTDLKCRAEAVTAVAAEHATAVDRAARFPSEAIAAARRERLLGIMVPRELGGESASISDVVDVCYALGRGCASTAMVHAMHQTKVALIVRHGRDSAWHQRLLQRLCD